MRIAPLTTIHTGVWPWVCVIVAYALIHQAAIAQTNEGVFAGRAMGT